MGIVQTVLLILTQTYKLLIGYLWVVKTLLFDTFILGLIALYKGNTTANLENNFCVADIDLVKKVDDFEIESPDMYGKTETQPLLVDDSANKKTVAFLLGGYSTKDFQYNFQKYNNYFDRITEELTKNRPAEEKKADLATGAKVEAKKSPSDSELAKIEEDKNYNYNKAAYDFLAGKSDKQLGLIFKNLSAHKLIGILEGNAKTDEQSKQEYAKLVQLFKMDSPAAIGKEIKRLIKEAKSEDKTSERMFLRQIVDIRRPRTPAEIFKNMVAVGKKKNDAQVTVEELAVAGIWASDLMKLSELNPPKEGETTGYAVNLKSKCEAAVKTMTPGYAERAYNFAAKAANLFNKFAEAVIARTPRRSVFLFLEIVAIVLAVQAASVSALPILFSSLIIGGILACAVAQVYFTARTAVSGREAKSLLVLEDMYLAKAGAIEKQLNEKYPNNSELVKKMMVEAKIYDDSSAKTMYKVKRENKFVMIFKELFIQEIPDSELPVTLGATGLYMKTGGFFGTAFSQNAKYGGVEALRQVSPRFVSTLDFLTQNGLIVASIFLFCIYGPILLVMYKNLDISNKAEKTIESVVNLNKGKLPNYENLEQLKNLYVAMDAKIARLENEMVANGKGLLGSLPEVVQQVNIDKTYNQLKDYTSFSRAFGRAFVEVLVFKGFVNPIKNFGQAIANVFIDVANSFRATENQIQTFPRKPEEATVTTKVELTSDAAIDKHADKIGNKRMPDVITRPYEDAKKAYVKAKADKAEKRAAAKGEQFDRTGAEEVAKEKLAKRYDPERHVMVPGSVVGKVTIRNKENFETGHVL